MLGCRGVRNVTDSSGGGQPEGHHDVVMIQYIKLLFLPVIGEALTNIGSYLTRGKLRTLTRAFKHISTHIHTQRERQHSAGSVLVSHVHSLSLSCDAVCLADCWSSQIHLAWQQNDLPDLSHCLCGYEEAACRGTYFNSTLCKYCSLTASLCFSSHFFFCSKYRLVCGMCLAHLR